MTAEAEADLFPNENVDDAGAVEAVGVVGAVEVVGVVEAVGG